MRESDRPPAERVSSLDGAPHSADREAVESLQGLTDAAAALERVRLALKIGDREVLIGRDGGEGLTVIVHDRTGAGAAGSLRSVLREHGAIVVVNGSAARVLVAGIVADNVTAVRVGDRAAALGRNGFLAEIGPDGSPVVVVTTPEGEREVGLRTRP